jgi:hypothetical protein
MRRARAISSSSRKEEEEKEEEEEEEEEEEVARGSSLNRGRVSSSLLLFWYCFVLRSSRGGSVEVLLHGMGRHHGDITDMALAVLLRPNQAFFGFVFVPFVS